MSTVFLRLLLLLLVVASPAWSSPEKWKSTIDTFVAADAAHPQEHNAVVFVGSSSIVKWKSLKEDFPFPVINRGFGGSELADSVAYIDQVVIPYHPRAVVLYAGDNDIAAGKSPEKVLADFQTFRTKLHAALPSTALYYLSIKYSPSRAKFQAAMQRVNELIAADCAASSECHFVDVNAAMLGADGRPRPELFESDQLHMKASTYALWTNILRPLLKP